MSNILVSYDDYTRITGDETTSQDAVEATLDDMLAMIEEELDRILSYGTYTEELPVNERGRVFPRAVPMASVPASASYQIDDEGWSLRGVTTSPLTDSPLDLDDLEIRNISGEPTRFATVTYSGGYHADDFPVRLRRLICRLSRESLKGGSRLLPGTTAASVGDVSISLESGTVGTGELDAILPGTCESLCRYRRPTY